MGPLIADAADPARWRLVGDRVMGGVSDGKLAVETVAGRRAVRMSGVVSLENDGGFLQIALDLDPAGGLVDARAYSGLVATIRGDGGAYGLHLRSADVLRPWQSYRAPLPAATEWTEAEIAFGAFRPHRIDAPLDLSRLRRLGFVAIGRAGPVDLAVAAVRFAP